MVSVSEKKSSYMFGNIPLVRDNLGVILVVGIGAVVGPLMLAAFMRLLRRKPRRALK